MASGHFEIRIMTTQTGYAAIVIKDDRRYVHTNFSFKNVVEYALNEVLDGGVKLEIERTNKGG